MMNKENNSQNIIDQVKDLQKKVSELETLVAEKDNVIKKLKESESILEMLLKNIPNQVFWKDRGLVYLGCNQAFADITGMNNPPEVTGKTDFDFHRDPAHAESYRAWDIKIMEKDEAVLDIEELYHKADSSEGTVLTSKVPLKNPDGQVFGILGICTDITERKKIEQKNEALINELKDAISEVKKLSGLLPICSNCKGIRDDKGYWNQLEKYLSEHTDAGFTHSICPECYKKLYPDLWEKRKQ